MDAELVDSLVGHKLHSDIRSKHILHFVLKMFLKN